MNSLTLSQPDIALRAYHIYLDTGCAHGHDWEHWFQAEKELGAMTFTTTAEAAPVAKKAAKKAVAKKAPAKKAVKKTAKA
jgi:hypothetical protein